MNKPNFTAQAGFSILELMITLTLFSGLLTLFSMSLRQSSDGQRASMDSAEAQANAQKGIAAIREILGQTGLAGGYPEVYEGNTIGAGHPALAHPAPVSYPNFPANRELVFRTLEDADGDGWPDINGAGQLIWSPVISAFIVAPDANGINRLYLVDTAGQRRSLARNVGSLVIDDSASSGFTIPLNQLRVRLFMAPNEREAQAATPLPLETRMSLAREEDAIW